MLCFLDTRHSVDRCSVCLSVCPCFVSSTPDIPLTVVLSVVCLSVHALFCRQPIPWISVVQSSMSVTLTVCLSMLCFVDARFRGYPCIVLSCAFLDTRRLTFRVSEPSARGYAKFRNLCLCVALTVCLSMLVYTTPDIPLTGVLSVCLSLLCFLDARFRGYP